MMNRCNTITHTGTGMPTVTLPATVKFSLRYFDVWAIAYIKLCLVNMLGVFSFFPMSDIIAGLLVSLLGSLSQAVNSDPALH